MGGHEAIGSNFPLCKFSSNLVNLQRKVPQTSITI
jgi:hypothetical protein